MKNKTLLWAALALLCVVLTAIAVCSTGDGSDKAYEYRGFVTEVGEDGRGREVITVINGTEKSTFTLRRSTWAHYREADHPDGLQEGDVIRLNTDRSGKYVREMYVRTGYVFEGRLVADDKVSPVLLTTDGDTGETTLIWLADAHMMQQFETGNIMRVYAEQKDTVVFNGAAELIAEGSRDAIGEEEKALLEKNGVHLAE